MAELGFWNLAQRDPDHLALVTPDGNEIAAGDLLADANRLARGLQALGLERGDSVATVLPNGREQVALWLAVTQIGGYFTPINFHLTGPEIAYIVGDCEAKALFGHERFTDSVTKAAEELSFSKEGRFGVGDVPGFRNILELLDGQSDAAPDNRSTGAAMHYTSGTTGRPKGVKRPLAEGVDPDTAAELFSMLLGLFGIQPHDNNVHLGAAPLYHTAVLTFGGNSVHMGHTLVLMDKWTPQDTLDLIERQRVTTTHMVPTMFHRLLALPDDVKEKADVSSLRHVIHAAAPCPVEIKRRMFEWWGPVIWEYYAATEGGGTIVSPEDWLKKPGTVGTPWPMSQVKVLDDNGNELPPNDVGTVWMAMSTGGFEYHKDPEKTNKAWKDGFFTVGDAGYLDDDGYLFLVDRKSDMIISGGVNIYPAEIEGVLLTMPKVGDAAVFGIPNEDWGEEVKAVVEPAAGIEPGKDLEDELRVFLTERLAKYKMPRTIDFVPELPRDPSGKLYKRKLRDPYWADREKAI